MHEHDKKEEEHLTGQLAKFVQGLLTGPIEMQLECCCGIRKIAANEKGVDVPFDFMIDSGIVPRLIEYLEMNSNEKNRKFVYKLQFEAGWILANISASIDSKHARCVISHGAVKSLVNLILSHDINVSEQVVWALVNIAGDSPQNRDIVLSNDILTNLMHLQNRCFGVLFDEKVKEKMREQLKAKVKANEQEEEQEKEKEKEKDKPREKEAERERQDLDCAIIARTIDILRTVTWTLSNLCRSEPTPESKYCKISIKGLNEMLKLGDMDSVILQDAEWGLSYLIDSSDTNVGDNDNEEKQFNERIELMKECGALERLVKCLEHDNRGVEHAVLCALG